MSTERSHNNRFVILGMGVFLGALLFYLPGLARSAMAGDPAVYCTRSALLLLDSFAQTHSLYLLLGHSLMRLTGLSAPVALSLLSALCGAGALCGLAMLTMLLSGNAWAGLASAVSLLVAHTMWMHAVMPEVYTLNLLFLVVMLLSAWKWLKTDAVLWLSLITFCGAWGSSNHLAAGLNAALVLCWAFSVSLRRGIRWRHWGMAILAGGIGLLPLGFLFWRDVGAHGFSVAFSQFLTGGSGVSGDTLKQYGNAMFGLRSFRAYLLQFAACVLALGYNFAGPQFFLAGLGIGELRSNARPFWTPLLLIFVVNFVFSATYGINEFWAFLLPCWLVVAVLAGMGWSGFFAVLGSHRQITHTLRLGLVLVMLLLPVGIYRLAVSVIENTSLRALEIKRDLGQVAEDKDYYEFYLWPPKGASSQADNHWLDAVDARLWNGDVVALRQAYYNLATYARLIEGRFKDNQVVALNQPDLLRRLRFGQRVFMAHPADFDETGLAKAGYRLEPSGVLFRVVK